MARLNLPIAEPARFQVEVAEDYDGATTQQAGLNKPALLLRGLGFLVGLAGFMLIAAVVFPSPSHTQSPSGFSLASFTPGGMPAMRGTKTEATSSGQVPVMQMRPPMERSARIPTVPLRNTPPTMQISSPASESLGLEPNEESQATTAATDETSDLVPEVEVVVEEESEEGSSTESLKESQFASYFAQLIAYSDNDEDKLAKFQTEVMALEKSVKDMEAQGEGDQDQIAKMQDQYMRSMADFQNLQKRSAKERADLGPMVRSKVIESILPVLDNFDFTAKNVKGETEGEEKIIQGYELLHKQLLDALEVKYVPGEGEPFDPSMHDAIMREESEDVAEDHITEELRRGYLVSDKLVRASTVKVSSGKPQSI